MTLEEVKDEVRWLIEQRRDMVENRTVSSNKSRWVLQGEWNAYENVLEMLEMLESIGTDTDEEDTDDE